MLDISWFSLYSQCDYFVTLHTLLIMEEILQLAKDLIRFRSIHSEPQAIDQCAASIENYLKYHGVTYRRIDQENIPSILVLPQSGYVPVLLMSHIDVVDGSDELFVPVERNGNLYGRGSIDDKYAVALSLALLKNYSRRLREKGKNQNDMPFGILITGDEEIGGKNGARKALELIKADFCIALDGGSLEEIIVKEKGILKLKMISRGKAAHGARPWLGENAIEKLMADYMKLKAFFLPPVPEDSDHWYKTINFSICHAGKSHNQVPDLAEAFFDIRYTENDNIDELVKNIQNEIESELVVEAIEPIFLSGGSPYLELLLDISKNTKTTFEHGASDARYLSDFGIKGIVWGANGDFSQHSDDEHVNIESVFKLYNILYEFMNRIDELST